ncbi:recombinase family protein [Anaerobacillus isosaccharinicus]|uniref:Recombinase family protein n=1 Tax=Anaerobacillus isosaccharinicus TaxID=1532552 RepID=A0A1S2M6M9_9BACI|nr:recombinase family protein [Anaerobacillus isosaccharinicus]MBA5585005.1 recombinase family protein [Anaerobacillus isosaccharinicus]QOY36642.1 recombinase family protein [Anaerobacillus isosaccharinicus]
MDINELLQPNRRCAFYGRYSTDKQDMDLQLDKAKQFAKDYQLIIVKKYTDESVSATKKELNERQKLNELIDDLSDDLFDFVIVFRIDRISRDPIEQEKIRKLFAAAGKPIVILSPTPTLDEEPGDVFGFIKSALGMFEIEQLRERVRSKGEAGAQKGEHQGGKAPYGYVYNKKTKLFNQVADEIINVRKIFDMYKQGLGCPKIADTLPKFINKKGEVKKWTRQKVESIIKNPKYAGYHLWGKRSNHKLSKGKKTIFTKLKNIEPIVTKEEWDFCNNLLQKRGKKLVDPKHLDTNYLVKNVITCGHCNSLLVPENQETNGGASGHRLYLCKTEKCKKVRIKAQPIDEIIRNRIRVEINMFAGNSLVNKINISLKNDNEKLNKQYKIIEDGIEQYSKKMREIDYKIHRLSKLELNEDNKNFIECFTMYRIDLTRKVELLEQELKKINKQKPELFILQS